MCKVTLKRIVNVHDCGSLINPALAEAQVHGGMSMGIGYGLSEQLLFDEKTGRPLNNNLLDYKLSTFMDHPNLEAEFVENYEPTSAFGTKALGEPPACSPAPAIRNAIYHATGRRHRSGADHAAHPLRQIHRSGLDSGLREGTD